MRRHAVPPRGPRPIARPAARRDPRGAFGAACAAVSVAIALGGCAKQESPGVAQTGTLAPTTAGTAKGTSPDGGACPAKTTLTIVDAKGKRTDVSVRGSYADLTGETGGQGLVLSFVDYEVDTGMLRGVYQPKLSTGQHYVTFSLASRAKVTPGTYVEQTKDPKAPLEINFTSVYTDAGRQLPTNDHTVEITEVTDTRVCGRIVPARKGASSTTEVEATFTATRIDT